MAGCVGKRAMEHPHVPLGRSLGCHITQANDASRVRMGPGSVAVHKEPEGACGGRLRADKVAWCQASGWRRPICPCRCRFAVVLALRPVKKCASHRTLWIIREPEIETGARIR